MGPKPRIVNPQPTGEEVQSEAEGIDTLYEVCNAKGARIALVRDRRMAFVLARQNDFAPVSVH